MYLPFNGNTRDESGFNNHAVVAGATLTTDRTGNSNSAYAFDGYNNHIEIPDLITSTSTAFTISACLKPTDIMTRRLCVYLGARTGEAWLQVQNGNFSFGAHPSDGTEPTVTTAAVNGVFSHVVALYRRGGTMQLWVNGAFRSEVSVSSYPLSSGSSTHASAVGSYAPLWLDWGRQNGLSSWLGTIDQVRVYDRALSQSEILSLYQGGA
jgi:hypothetical protein